MAAVIAVALLLAVIAGQLELKRKQLSLAVYLPAGAVTLLAVSTQVGPGVLGYLPAVLGLSAGYLTLRLLIAELRRPPGALEPIAAERRSFPRRPLGPSPWAGSWSPFGADAGAGVQQGRRGADQDHAATGREPGAHGPSRVPTSRWRA